MGRPSSFTAEEDTRLLDARDEQKLGWEEIGRMMNRPWPTCWKRYQALTQPQPPVIASPTIASKKPRSKYLHEELGIKTKVVEVSSYDRYQTRIMKITLPAV